MAGKHRFLTTKSSHLGTIEDRHIVTMRESNFDDLNIRNTQPYLIQLYPELLVLLCFTMLNMTQMISLLCTNYQQEENSPRSVDFSNYY